MKNKHKKTTVCFNKPERQNWDLNLEVKLGI